MGIVMIVCGAVAIFVAGCLVYAMLMPEAEVIIQEQACPGTVTPHKPDEQPEHAHFQKDGKYMRCGKCSKYAQYCEEGIYSCKKHKGKE